MCSCRGESFHKEYSHLGEIRSLIPASVHMMALTATATQQTRSKIITKLCMEHPFIMSISPHKKNIVYIVGNKTSVEEFVNDLASSLRVLRKEMPKTVVFCWRYEECSKMYRLFRHYLGDNFTEPPGISHRIASVRLVDMYTKCQEKDVKEEIIQSFCDPQGCLRIVIATINTFQTILSLSKMNLSTQMCYYVYFLWSVSLYFIGCLQLCGQWL